MTSASLSLLNIIRFYHKYSSWAMDDTNRTALQISLVLWMICQSRQCLSLTIFVLFMKFPSLKYHYHIYTARAWPISFEGGINFLVFLAATKQLYEWYFLSVCPSVRPSVCPSVRPSVCPSVRLSHLFDYVPIIVSSWNFQELSHWTRVRSMQKVKVRGQRSRSQRSRPKFSFPDCNSSLNWHMMIKLYI